MTSWHNEYLAALHERDKKEKANEYLYNCYTKLADRTGVLDGTIVSNTSQVLETEPASKPAQIPGGTKLRSRSPVDHEAPSKIRQDLAAAQRSKGEMQVRLQRLMEDLQNLRTQSRVESKRIDDLTAAKAALVIRIRDRDEELRGKAKLLEDVQDETVSLNLQLHMAEQQSEKLKGENQDLIDRWMARMGEEADAMNNASRFS